jgi:hypothetical protein
LSLAGGLPNVTFDYGFDNIRPSLNPPPPPPITNVNLPSNLPPTMGAWEVCKVIILQQPLSAGECVGNDVTFSVLAYGSAPPDVYNAYPLSYQWQVYPIGGPVWIDLANDGTYLGVNTANLSISGLTTGMNGNLYRCLITTRTPNITNPLCIKVVETNPATLSVSTPPTTSSIWHQ